MQLTTVKEIYRNREEYLDKEVTVGGWVRSVRDSKTFGFIVLHDGSFFETLQVVYHDTMENFQAISKLNVGAAIVVKGTLVATPQAKQPFEIQATEIMVEGDSAADYPLQKKRPLHGIFKNNLSFKTENKYFSGGIQSAFFNCLCYSSVLSGTGICICAHTIDYRKRL
jgi:asnS: asparaginyl-tRNA synthetase